MFKETFKYYKSKCPPPTYEKVIDFDTIDKDVSVNYISDFSMHNLLNIYFDFAGGYYTFTQKSKKSG